MGIELVFNSSVLCKSYLLQFPRFPLPIFENCVPWLNLLNVLFSVELANLLKALEWARHHCSIDPVSWLPHTLLIPSKCLHVLVFSVMQNHPTILTAVLSRLASSSESLSKSLCLVLWWPYPVYLELTDGKCRCPYLSQQENVDPSLNIWNTLLTANKKSWENVWTHFPVLVEMKFLLTAYKWVLPHLKTPLKISGSLSYRRLCHLLDWLIFQVSFILYNYFYKKHLCWHHSVDFPYNSLDYSIIGRKGTEALEVLKFLKLHWSILIWKW